MGKWGRDGGRQEILSILDNFRKTLEVSILMSESPSPFFRSKSIYLINNLIETRLILFRRKDKGKTSFTFLLKTQAEAIDKLILNSCSKRLLSKSFLFFWRIFILLSVSRNKPEASRSATYLIKRMSSPPNIADSLKRSLLITESSFSTYFNISISTDESNVPDFSRALTNAWKQRKNEDYVFWGQTPIHLYIAP